MFSIEEAKYAHPRATYHIPAGVRHEWGSEAIARELDAEATAVHHARVGKLKNAVTGLYQRIMCNGAKSAPSSKSGPTRHSETAIDQGRARLGRETLGPVVS